jgi:hypothetical protein
LFLLSAYAYGIVSVLYSNTQKSLQALKKEWGLRDSDLTNVPFRGGIKDDRLFLINHVNYIMRDLFDLDLSKTLYRPTELRVSINGIILNTFTRRLFCT